jgi:hypothetical protein
MKISTTLVKFNADAPASQGMGEGAIQAHSIYGKVQGTWYMCWKSLHVEKWFIRKRKGGEEGEGGK